MRTAPLTIYCILPGIRNAEQDQAIAQDGDHQRADQRAPDAAHAADEACPAQDNRGDGVKLLGLAKLQAVGGVEPRRLHDPSDAGKQAGRAVDEEEHPGHVDPCEPRRALIAANSVDMRAEHGAPQDQP